MDGADPFWPNFRRTPSCYSESRAGCLTIFMGAIQMHGHGCGSLVRGGWVLLSALGSCLIGVDATIGQTLTGPFQPFNSWWLDPATGLGGVTPGVQICIDLDGNGSTEACYDRPVVPAGGLTNLRLSPTRRILMAYGNTSDCSGSSMVHFFDVPDPPASLTLIDSACIPNNVGTIGFYDTGLCCNGLADLSCPSSGLTCVDGGGNALLGVSPQRIAYVSDLGDPFTQRVQITWFDLNAGVHTQTFPGFNSQLQLTRVPVSPYGDVAFVQHDLGGPPNSDYTAVDLCAGDRFGQPLSSSVGGALFDIDPPVATAAMADAGGGNFVVSVMHPDLLGGQLDLNFTPCGDDPPPVDGACCRLDGCSLETVDDCELLTGSWLGPDTDCGDCPTATLTLQVQGNGSVSSSPSGISCPSDCDETYAVGQEVTLTASAAGDSLFTGWSGACGGNDPMISVAMDGDRLCIATFVTVADLSITKVDDVDPVTAGEALGYTLTVSNAGPADATNVTVSDSLPSGVMFDAGASDGSCDISGSFVTCVIGDLPGGENRVIAIGVVVDPETRGALFNTASVSGSEFDNDIFNNSSNASTSVQAFADLSVTKTGRPDPVAAGGTLLYEITVFNAGPSSATGVDVTDTFPAGVTPLSDPANPGSLTCDVGGGRVGVGETLSVSFSALVDVGVADGSMLTNSVEVSANEIDPDPSNNMATFDSTVSGQVFAPAGPTFTKVADTDTPIPGGVGTFTSFGVLNTTAISEGNVTFIGLGDQQDGVYFWSNGVLSVVADVNTPIPGGTGNFGAPLNNGFNRPTIDGEDVAFGGASQTVAQRGVYTRVDGVLDVVADKTTMPVGASFPFSTLGSASLDDGNISFWAFVPDFPILEGLYFGNPSGITKIADETTFIPGGGGRFEGFNPNSHHRNGTVVFYGLDSAFNSGLYRWVGGVLSVIANRFTPIPGGTGNFDFFLEQVSHDGSNIAFRGNDSTLLNPGIYMNDCGGLRAVVDTSTPVPCANGMFEGIGEFASQGGRTVFTGSGGGSSGLYMVDGNRVIKVLEALDRLDGKKIQSIRVGPDSMDGDQAVFLAFFTDDSQGVYVVDLTTSGVCNPNDVDDDNDRDLVDFGAFQACATQSGQPFDAGCEIFDNDGDGDVDLFDFPPFEELVTGPLAPAAPEACCLDGGQCLMLDPCECEVLQNGTPMPGMTCVDNPCVPEQGACCSFKGCFVTTAELCNNLEGTHYPGLQCFEVECKFTK